jgi:hypothetical protein
MEFFRNIFPELFRLIRLLGGQEPDKTEPLPIRFSGKYDVMRGKSQFRCAIPSRLFEGFFEIDPTWRLEALDDEDLRPLWDAL